MSKLRYSYFEPGIEFGLTRQDAIFCTPQGIDAEPHCKQVLSKRYVKRQFKNISPDTLREALQRYGAWTEQELSIDLDNILRLIWLAAVI